MKKMKKIPNQVMKAKKIMKKQMKKKMKVKKKEKFQKIYQLKIIIIKKKIQK